MAQNPSRARFLTVAEVAQIMRVSTMTVYRLIKAGELASVRVGKSYRIREDDVDAYLPSATPRPADPDTGPSLGLRRR
ncbi:MAG: helix-turn-helix domain-containing protein [Acidimicrobiales bacterium]